MDLDTLPTVALPWHCQPIGTIKIGVYDVIGELFVIDHRDLSWVGCICWHHSGDLCAFGHVVCHAPMTFVGVSSCCCLYIVVISANSCPFDSCYGPMGGTVKWLIVWGVMMASWEIMLCSCVFWFVELRCWHGCCWNFDYRFHSFVHAVLAPRSIGNSFLGAVSVPHGIGMIWFGSNKNNVPWANRTCLSRCWLCLDSNVVWLILSCSVGQVSCVTFGMCMCSLWVFVE